MKKRVFIIAAMLLLSLFLSSCINTSSQERAKAKELERTYAKSFMTIAKEEFGVEAKVAKISACYKYVYNTVWPGGSRYVNGILQGTVTIGEESFSAKYDTSANTIISHRNYDSIIDSLKDYFAYLDLDIVGGRIVDSARETWYLPENIKTFEDMLLNELFMQIVILTTSDIEHLTRDDVYIPKINGSLAFVQIGDQTDIDELLKFTFTGATSIDFSNNVVQKIRRDGEDVDPFDYYDIQSSVFFGESKFPFYRYQDESTDD